MRQSIAKVAAGMAAVLILAPSTASADKGCRNVQSRCAMKIGGRCDPVSGRWEYGRNGAGGTAMAHNECISRELAKQKNNWRKNRTNSITLSASSRAIANRLAASLLDNRADFWPGGALPGSETRGGSTVITLPSGAGCSRPAWAPMHLRDS